MKKMVGIDEGKRGNTHIPKNNKATQDDQTVSSGGAAKYIHTHTLFCLSLLSLSPRTLQ